MPCTPSSSVEAVIDIAPADNRERETPWFEQVPGMDLVGMAAREQVEVSWQKRLPVVEQRQTHRYPYREQLGMTPADEFEVDDFSNARLVWGENISQGGLAFRHEQPIVLSRAVITFFDLTGANCSVEVQIRWCRFMRNSRYQSGGQVVRLVEMTDLMRGVDWHQLVET